MAIVAQLDDDPEILDLVSWKIGSAPIGRHDDYLRALHRAEAAVRLAPENGTYSTTPGVALYRVGCDQEAIDTLNRATALDTSNGGGPAPTKLAFLAMAHHRLGHAAESHAGLETLRSRMNPLERLWVVPPSAAQ